jgi:hypothetical protein
MGEFGAQVSQNASDKPVWPDSTSRTSDDTSSMREAKFLHISAKGNSDESTE